MSNERIAHNPDVQRLLDEGYSVTLEGNCIVVRDVPYLDSTGNAIEDGVLVDAYPQSDHTFHFSGIPHKTDGKTLHVANSVQEWNGFSVSVRLSLKKNVDGQQVNYDDYYDKVTYYIDVLSAHAKSRNPDVTAQKYRPIDTSEESDTPFNYQDSNSSRAGINHISKKLEGQKIAIIGVGGTGAYVLDLVAKTPADEIHIYDGDTFHTHNAFRVPGAASKEALDTPTKKVLYFHEIYARMRKRILPHEYPVTKAVISSEFGGFNFVFVCMDPTEDKEGIISQLTKQNIPFVDCGIGIEDADASLYGTLRLTTVTSTKADHIRKRIPRTTNEANLYGSNIQIAELNALTAALAVIRWKKLIGFYHDNHGEHHSTYLLNTNSLTNDETVEA